MKQESRLCIKYITKKNRQGWHFSTFLARMGEKLENSLRCKTRKAFTYSNTMRLQRTVQRNALVDAVPRSFITCERVTDDPLCRYYGPFSHSYFVQPRIVHFTSVFARPRFWVRCIYVNRDVKGTLHREHFSPLSSFQNYLALSQVNNLKKIFYLTFSNGSGEVRK